jgi:membrane protein implicated in regulation of membrane protease activity
MAEKWHSGITMHKLSFGSGFIGLLFAAGSALIFVLGFPTLWYFVALAFALGLAIAAVLRFANNWQSRRNQPLSIMTASDEVRADSSAAGRDRQLLQATPKFASA